MKNNHLNIIKKAYHKPLIEETLFDREFSLVMESLLPPVEPDPDVPPLGMSSESLSTTTLQAESPFKETIQY